MSDRLSFDGRVAIVTGAGGSAGLGRAYARLLAERGAKVVVNDTGVSRDGTTGVSADAEAVAAEIVAAGGDAIADFQSVAEPESAKRIVKGAIDRWGRVDILINNAMIGARAAFDEITDADIERVVGVNLMGSIWMSRAVWPHMLKSRYGRIVNTTSGGMMGMPCMTAYGAAKFGIYGLTRGLATEGADHGIKVNAIMPGAATNSLGRFMTLADPDVVTKYRAGFPAGLVAPVVAYLSHEACEVSGTLVSSGGGSVSARVIGATVGIRNTALTIEDVRDNLSAIFDLEDMEIVTDPKKPLKTGTDPVGSTMVPVPYRPG